MNIIKIKDKKGLTFGKTNLYLHRIWEMTQVIQT